MSVIASYASRLSGAAARTRSRVRWVIGYSGAPILRALLAVGLVLFSGSRISRGTESNAPPPTLSVVETTNIQQILRACLQLQEQLHAAQRAVELSRQESQTAATQNAAALAEGLQNLQAALSAQRAREFAATQEANRVLFMVGGAFAALGLLAVLMMTYFQWRTSSRLADIAAAFPRSHELGPAPEMAALGSGKPNSRSSAHLLGALEQLDRRIHEFKRAISSNGNGDPTAELDRLAAASGPDPAEANPDARVSGLLNQAHSLMSLENAEAAVACFDQVLALEPNHTEALVKKGAALERLQRLNEAIECYDRAIAVDGTMTTAYLHKGGLCNRLERFKEALQCYEKALRAHDQRGG